MAQGLAEPGRSSQRRLAGLDGTERALRARQAHDGRVRATVVAAVLPVHLHLSEHARYRRTLRAHSLSLSLSLEPTQHDLPACLLVRWMHTQCRVLVPVPARSRTACSRTAACSAACSSRRTSSPRASTKTPSCASLITARPIRHRRTRLKCVRTRLLALTCWCLLLIDGELRGRRASRPIRTDCAVAGRERALAIRRSRSTLGVLDRWYDGPGVRLTFAPVGFDSGAD